MVARMLGSAESAEDAVQDVMMKLWQERKKVTVHPNIPALVFRAARNHCIDRLRRNRLTLHSYDSALHDQQVSLSNNEAETNELNRLIKETLIELPEKQAEVLMLRDLDQLEFIEIAQLLDLKVENVRMLLSRARKKMGEKLTKIYNYEVREQKSTGG